MAFLFGKYFRTVLGTRCSGCFQAKLQKRFSHIFSLIFGPTSLSFLSKIFCWLLGPRRLFLTLRNLGRMASLLLVNFILQVTYPRFFKMVNFVEKIMGCISEFLWLKINRVFQVVSGKFQLTCSTSCGSSFYFWNNYFVNISLGFLFKQVSTIIFFIGFHSNIKSFKSLFPARKSSQGCDI